MNGFKCSAFALIFYAIYLKRNMRITDRKKLKTAVL